MLNYLIHGHIGYAWGIRIAALVTLVCFVVGFFLMRWPKKPFGGQAFGSTESTGTLTIHSLVGTDLPYVLTLCQGFIMSLGTFVPPFYIQLFAKTHGISDTLSFYALSVLNLTGMIGRVAPNYLGDRVGLLNVYVPCLTLTGTYFLHSG